MVLLEFNVMAYLLKHRTYHMYASPLSHDSFTSPSSFLNFKGFLGAGVGALGIAVTSSLSGSGVPVPNLPVPKVEVSTKSAPPKAASAPQSKIAFTRAPKGKYLAYYNTLIMIQGKLLTCQTLFYCRIQS